MKHDYAKQFKKTTTNWWVIPAVVIATIIWLILFLAVGELPSDCIGGVCI